MRIMFCLLNINCQLVLTNKLPDILMNILVSTWVLISHSFWEILVTGRQAEINTWEFDFCQLPIITYSILYACLAIPSKTLKSCRKKMMLWLLLTWSNYSLLTTCYFSSLAFFIFFHIYPRSVLYHTCCCPSSTIIAFL